MKADGWHLVSVDGVATRQEEISYPADRAHLDGSRFGSAVRTAITGIRFARVWSRFPATDLTNWRRERGTLS